MSDLAQQYQLSRMLQQGRRPTPAQQYAAALLARGSSTAPVSSPLEGLARMLTAGVGGYLQHRNEQQGEAREQETLARILGGEETRKIQEADALARAGVPGFRQMPEQPEPGRGYPQPTAVNGVETVPQGALAEAPPANPQQPVTRDLLSQLAALGAGGNRTAAGVLPGMSAVYADQRAEEREAEANRRADAREARLLAAQGRETFGQPVQVLRNGQPVLVRFGSRGGVQPVEGYGLPPDEGGKPSALEQRVKMMVDTGVPENIAKGIVSGRIEVKTANDGSVQFVDVATRELLPIGGVGGGAGGVGGGQGVGAGDGATIPTAGVDYPGATGLGGAIGEAANILVDVFDGNLPAPEQARATQALKNLDARTRMFLQTAIPGRPSNYLMEMIGGLTLKPGEITMGAGRASERVRQTTDFLAQTIREMEEISGSQGTGRFTRETISEANRALTSLRPMLRDYQVLNDAFRQKMGGDLPLVRTPEEARRLAPGTRFRREDGAIGTVPAR